ncbi:MAG: hypothetical protein J5894_02385, partial [Clostridia bacterium]|nr:hypothetical protein [Clostridia bacterium]
QLKITAIGLSLLLIFCSLSACGNKQETGMSDERGNVITLGEYSLMGSLMKGNMAYYIRTNYGDYNSSDFWATIVDAETQITYKDYYTVVLEEKAKAYLAALSIYSELGLELPSATLEAIDEDMQYYVNEDGNGSKKSLNAILAEYGTDYDSLRNYKIMNAKISQLKDEIYGKSASKVAANVKQEYLEKNYVAFKQILIPTYGYAYDTDENGDEIYYRMKEDGSDFLYYERSDAELYPRIAYDKKNGTRRFLDENEVEKDDNFDDVYYTDWTYTKIAYDTENGARAPIYDESGNQMFTDYSPEKKAEQKLIADSVLELVNNAASTEEIEALIEEYDGNYNEDSKGYMFYLATNVTYSSFMSGGELSDEIRDVAAGLEVGKAAIFTSDNGYHVVIRYEVETGAYGINDYSGWFVDDNGNYDFAANLVNELFMARLEPYEEKITISEEAAGKVDISTVGPNYYFY